MSISTSNPNSDHLVELAKSAPFYQAYQDAYRLATGLPLVLIPANSRGFNACHGSANQNGFCRLANQGGSCASCVGSFEDLMDSMRDSVRARTIECSAGMKETLVPVRVGNSIVAYLKTGQVFTKKPTASQSKSLRADLESDGRTKKEIEKALAEWKMTPQMTEEDYQARITILSAFALQLAGLMNRIVLEDRKGEPDPVRKAKTHVCRNLDKKLSLEEVAAQVNVSSFYFCKLFKQATGMTFTEYVNRERIERARRELVKPGRRITEVAYDVGYQSLSQFNRSFLKIMGESPSQYRKRTLEGSRDFRVA